MCIFMFIQLLINLGTLYKPVSVSELVCGKEARSMKKFVDKGFCSMYCRKIYIPTFTHDHELWVLTEIIRLKVQVVEMWFLHKVAELNLWNRMKSFIIQVKESTSTGFLNWKGAVEVVWAT